MAENQEFQNLYEVVKTVRFGLEYISGVPIKIPDKNLKIDLGDFIKTYKDILESFDALIHIQDKKGNFKLNKKIKIKFPWLKTYLKNRFIEVQDDLKEKNKNNPKYALPRQYEISKFIDEIAKWVNDNFEIIDSLQNLENRKEEERSRRSEFAHFIKQLKSRNGFEFIKELFNENIVKASIDDAKLNKINLLVKNFDELLLKALDEFLPSQSSGVKVAGASFNFNTVNKYEKGYFEAQVLKEQENLKKVVPRIKFQKKDKNKNIEFELDRVFCNKIGLNEDIFSKSVDEVYSIIKSFKADAKSKFLEAISQNKIHFGNLSTNYPLFEAREEDFNEFIRLTELINVNNENKNHLLEDGKSKTNQEIQNIDRDTEKLAQERGAFFNAPKKPIKTKNYFQLCEIYKQIALYLGQIYSRIKGNDAEKVDAISLNHWSLILEENNKHFLVLIPRSKMSETKKYLDGLDKNLTGSKKIHYFQSLTLRALEKLCFKEFGNSFAPIINQEGVDFPKFKQELDEFQLIKFYQKVLKTNYAQQEIGNFDNISTVLNEEYEYLDEFESDLEKVCYKKSVIVDESLKSTLLEKYQASIYEITSQDLKLDNQIRGIKKHTEFWQNFWSDENIDNHYTTRLNPQISISWREKDENWQKNIRNGDWQLPTPTKLEKFRNRKLEPQFTLYTTITLNATSKKMNFAFNQVGDIRDKIDSFNGHFNQNIKPSLPYYYGIDRGLKELATLCIVKFSDELNSFGVAKPEEFIDIGSRIDVWKLKKECYFEEFKNEHGEIVKNINNEPIIAIKNISKFIENGDLFEKFENQKISCIDLSFAKLINGKIVLNGDLMTYLKLKDLAAKRRIKEMLELGLLNNEASFTGKNVLQLNNEDIYWLLDFQKEQITNKYKQLPLKANIIEHFQNYIEKLKENRIKERVSGISNQTRDVMEIEHVNHLRDAITANMVGIIAHLQKYFPGILALENMSQKEHYDKHLEQNNQNISKRLEWSLYRKFAVQSLVPPKIQQSVFMREELLTNQFGIIHFVNISDTTNSCPNCEFVYSESEKQEFQKNKRSGIYVCNNPNCSFNSNESNTELKSLDNSDKVAAYNIAKNAFNSKN